jgi:hypothetical protein
MVLCCARVGHHLSLATLRHSGRVERDTPRIGDTVDLLRRGVRVYRNKLAVPIVGSTLLRLRIP